MFPNQQPGYLPNAGTPAFNLGMTSLPSADAQQTAPRAIPGVQLSDIYQAAKKRAVEDHELDKLFNAEFYGDAI
ncbi:MAG TPA: hypothetical protein VH107_21530 [Lacipirellulaceae bacterium]|jgi:Skp family chaperone for outer membrane proteins|nr:hypothetical protein [Lacipirellulaceae bacterium]